MAARPQCVSCDLYLWTDGLSKLLIWFQRNSPVSVEESHGLSLGGDSKYNHCGEMPENPNTLQQLLQQSFTSMFWSAAVSFFPPCLSPTAEELPKELGTVPASVRSKHHIQVSAESVYRTYMYRGPVPGCQPTSKAMKHAPVFHQDAHPSAVPGSWGIWGVTAASPLSVHGLMQMDSGAVTAQSGARPHASCLWQG